jgi:SAM-dependent methyltransferase
LIIKRAAALRHRLKRAFAGSGGGADFTGDGERVDIDLSGKAPLRAYESFDIYEKSHFKRYEFACSLLPADALVGDFACGTAYGTVMLSRQARHAFGCDLNSKVIQVMRKRYREVPNVTLLQGDILKLTGVPTLDFITSFETIEHFEEELVLPLFGKFNELLRPGGTLIFSTPYMQPKTVDSMKHHRTFWIDEPKLQEWTRQAGFRVSNFYYQNYQSHDVSEALDNKEMIVCICRKEGAAHE